MMEYAPYPQQQQTSHSGYPNSGAGATIPSPTNHSLSHHTVQTSPILSTQQHPTAHSSSHAMYQPQYGVPQQSIPNVTPYGMPGIQAAAMAATAAASGSTYPYMHSDPGMGQTSPRMAANAKKEGRSSPRMSNMPQIPGRRHSQVTSPGVPSAAGMIGHGHGHGHHGPRPGVAPPQMPPAPTIHGPHSPEIPALPVEESPLYVNAKQFHRILKRRVARQRLEEQLRLTSKGRKPYLHESRHNHAMRRPRGPGGRFLTADEVAAMESKAGEKDGESIGEVSPAKTVESIGTKRKSDSAPSSNSKKNKTRDADADDNGDEEEES